MFNLIKFKLQVPTSNCNLNVEDLYSMFTDIDECADPEISSRCPHGCENTPGSYRCKEDTTISPIDNNVIESVEDNNIEISSIPKTEDDDDDVDEDNVISSNQDQIDDNEDDDDDENDRDDNNEENNEIYDQNILKTCGDGYKLDENNDCVDIDECALGNTGCQFCKNVNGGVSIYHGKSEALDVELYSAFSSNVSVLTVSIWMKTKELVKT